MKKVRYAVVGLGWIAQDVVLPAFAHAKNSELVALVSDDPVKLRKLSRKYKVAQQYSYEEYADCLNSGSIDAVYIALPNALHRDYAIQAAQAGIHVLCEKPMALTEKDCLQMRAVAQGAGVKMMIAYRLHFEEGNLKAIAIADSGKLGDICLFDSTFTMNVDKKNVRWDKELSGGTMYDTGIYSINAVRNIFKEEPIEVTAFAAKGKKREFKGVEDSIGVSLLFPSNRIANILCSFASATTAAYDIIGSKGTLRVDPAFHHKEKVKHTLMVGKKPKHTTFPARDQFAPELVYFSDCILKDKDPEPSGVEGQADVRIIEAIYQSAKQHKPVRLAPFDKHKRPTVKQAITRFGVAKPKMVHVKEPSK